VLAWTFIRLTTTAIVVAVALMLASVLPGAVMAISWEMTAGGPSHRRKEKARLSVRAGLMGELVRSFLRAVPLCRSPVNGVLSRVSYPGDLS
jgi:di/tricarboxylate transporter